MAEPCLRHEVRGSGKLKGKIVAAPRPNPPHRSDGERGFDRDSRMIQRSPARFADPAQARSVAQAFDLRHLPADYYANPYPTYHALREHAPVHRMPDGGCFLSRYADCARALGAASADASDATGRRSLASRVSTANCCRERFTPSMMRCSVFPQAFTSSTLRAASAAAPSIMPSEASARSAPSAAIARAMS